LYYKKILAQENMTLVLFLHQTRKSKTMNNKQNIYPMQVFHRKLSNIFFSISTKGIVRFDMCKDKNLSSGVLGCYKLLCPCIWRIIYHNALTKG